MTSGSGVTNLYDVMDTAYDAIEILEHSKSLGHVPIAMRPAKRGKQDAAPEQHPAGQVNIQLGEKRTVSGSGPQSSAFMRG